MNSSENIDNETVCCNLFSFTPLTKYQIEELFDDNDNVILIVCSDNKFPNTLISYDSRSKLYDNNILIVRKISMDLKFVIVLVYYISIYNEKRKLLDGKIYFNDEKYNIVNFEICEALKTYNIEDTYIAKCIIE